MIREIFGTVSGSVYGAFITYIYLFHLLLLKLEALRERKKERLNKKL